MELIRALTLTWLFSGLRSDEISRLRLAASAGSTTGCPSRVTPARSSPRTPFACSTYRSTRPAPRSPSPSTRSSARPSKPGRPCGPPSPRGWTARPASRPTCCSPSARTLAGRRGPPGFAGPPDVRPQHSLTIWDDRAILAALARLLAAALRDSRPGYAGNPAGPASPSDHLQVDVPGTAGPPRDEPGDP